MILPIPILSYTYDGRQSWFTVGFAMGENDFTGTQSTTYFFMVFHLLMNSLSKEIAAKEAKRKVDARLSPDVPPKCPSAL